MDGFDPAQPIERLKQERFAQLCASGCATNAAYVKAGYKLSGDGANARKLKQNPQVKARIEWLRTRSAEKITDRVAEIVTASLEDIAYSRGQALLEAEEARQLAGKMGQSGAMVAAVRLKAQLAGLPIGAEEAERPPAEKPIRDLADPRVVEQIDRVRNSVRKLVVVDGGKPEQKSPNVSQSPNSAAG